MLLAKFEVLLVKRATVDVAVDQSCRILLAKFEVLLVNLATVDVAVDQSCRIFDAKFEVLLVNKATLESPVDTSVCNKGRKKLEVFEVYRVAVEIEAEILNFKSE
jgi:hypothetical protein